MVVDREYLPATFKVVEGQTLQQEEATLSALTNVTSVARHAGIVERWPRELKPGGISMSSSPYSQV